ncbi:hypothetical protein [Oligoflexus tunisiensis]|uniref:hypothetical protein n=1 Tax=Oligoflexus tunisiensis TaxID=708132 RepID=UPI00114CCE91|nr:hypothetical protein [Oligoflexus tunisiensis]
MSLGTPAFNCVIDRSAKDQASDIVHNLGMAPNFIGSLTAESRVLAGKPQTRIDGIIATKRHHDGDQICLKDIARANPSSPAVPTQ